MDGIQRASLLKILVEDIQDAQDDLNSETPGVAAQLALKVGMHIAVELNACANALQDIKLELAYANTREDNT